MESLQNKVLTAGNQKKIKPLSMLMVCYSPNPLISDWNNESSINTIASLYAIECMLVQEGSLDHHSIYFSSRRFSFGNYTTIEPSLS